MFCKAFCEDFYQIYSFLLTSCHLAVFPTEVDELQVQLGPRLSREQRHKVFFHSDLHEERILVKSLETPHRTTTTAVLEIY